MKFNEEEDLLEEVESVDLDIEADDFLTDDELILEDEDLIEVEEPDFGIDDLYSFEAEIDMGFDTISNGVSESVSSELPESHIFIEGLVLMEQVVGARNEDDPELFILPVYAEKNGEPKFVTYIEVTTENIMLMKLGGLDIKLVIDNKPPITFDNPNDYVKIIKTLRSEDTVAISYLVDIGDSIIEEELYT